MPLTYNSVLGIRKLENVRHYFIRTYGHIDVAVEPDMIHDVVREDGMMMVSSYETLDVEDVVFKCIDIILVEEVSKYV